MGVFADKLFDLVADVWLGAELDCGKVADTITDNLFCWVLIVKVVFSFHVRALGWLGRQVHHLLCLQVLQELVPG